MTMTRHHALRPLLALITASALAACSGNNEDAAQNNGNETSRPDPNNNGGNNTQTSKWTLEVLARDAGEEISVARSASGDVGVAFFADAGVRDGDCTEAVEAGTPAPPKIRWGLSYARRGQDSWSIEEVRQPIYQSRPRGLDLAFDPSGIAHIAVMTGDPIPPLISYCGANDVGYLTRTGEGAWELETAVTSSGEAAIGEPASDYGEVVGLWPALGYDAEGNPAIAYKDVHAGGIQSDDRRRADLELAWRQGGWDALPVEMGIGAGDHNEMVFDGEDRLTLAYYIPTENQAQEAKKGIWVRQYQDDETWRLVQLYNQGTPTAHSLLWHPDEEALYVAFYESSKGFPRLAKLVDDAEFESPSAGWVFEDIGDSRYDEGYDSSMALTESGRLAIAYYRCTESTMSLGDCLPQDDALVFKWRDRDEWVTEIVDEGDDLGLCGMDPSLTIDADGHAVIAYRCEETVDGELRTVVKVAQRRALP